MTEGKSLALGAQFLPTSDGLILFHLSASPDIKYYVLCKSNEAIHGEVKHKIRCRLYLNTAYYYKFANTYYDV